MPEGANATTELQHEHAGIERLVQRIAVLEPSAERTELVGKAGTLFLTHARTEERYLYPAFRRYLPQGIDQTVEQQQLVAEVRDVLEGMERTAENDEGYEALVARLVLDIQQHIEQQDSVLLPQLLDLCPREEINSIGRQMRYGLDDERGTAED